MAVRRRDIRMTPEEWGVLDAAAKRSERSGPWLLRYFVRTFCPHVTEATLPVVKTTGDSDGACSQGDGAATVPETGHGDAPAHDPPERREERKNELDTSAKPALPAGMVKRIAEHLNAKAGTSYRATGRKIKELIRARVNEGGSESDFITVIDKKCQEWLGTDMERYLRPLTLFGPKFDEYLGQRAIKSRQGKLSVIEDQQADQGNHIRGDW
jgi:uncharacterized phage protein (TIGR02220 family)